jgi:hypothetical protein
MERFSGDLVFNGPNKKGLNKKGGVQFHKFSLRLVNWFKLYCGKISEK